MLRYYIAFFEILLDTSFDLSSLHQDIGVCLLFAENVAEAHEQDQEDMLDYEQDCDELYLVFLDWGFEGTEKTKWILNWFVIGLEEIVFSFKVIGIDHG